MEPVGRAEQLVAAWPLAVFRIAFGVMYLDMALQKAPWTGLQPGVWLAAMRAVGGTGTRSFSMKK